jgi:hypothetical protein
MKVAIHQPHYFPWLGYLDKMAKVDKFVMLDEVQLSDNSNMFRNKFLTKTGKIRYLTIPFEKESYMKKRFCDVRLNMQINWQKDHENFIVDTYRKLSGFDETWSKIKHIFEKDYETVYEVCMESIYILRDLFGIDTALVYQSAIEYNRNSKKNDLVLELCKANNAQEYLSGVGAKKYMKVESFEASGIRVVYQQFTHPQYTQYNSKEFVSNLSALDLLFNCGIEESRRIFWENVTSVNEFIDYKYN